MSKSSRSERVQVWTERLRRYCQSELTVADFCRHEGVSTPSFYQWKKRLAAEGQEDVGTDGRFLSLQLVNSAATPVALVRLPGGVTEELARANENLKFELEQLKRYIYGQRSERHVDESQFPDHLPREVETIDVPVEDRICPCCGEEMPIIDTDIRQRLDFIPASLVVHERHYPKRACGSCSGSVTLAPPPEADQPGASLTPGSRYGFGVTVQIMLGKFADHLPLYRLEDIFARSGVVIPRSTQVGLLDAATDLIRPLTDYIKTLLLSSRVIGMDDTPVRLQDASLPGRMRTARFWLCRGRDEAPYNVFFFHESRERDGPKNFLGDYEGWVTVDAYGVENGVYLPSKKVGVVDSVLASCCNTHARRKFESTIYTLVASASRHNLDLWAYIDDVLRRLSLGNAELDDLLPDRWAAAHPESIREYRRNEKAARKAKTKSRRARRRKLAAKRG